MIRSWKSFLFIIILQIYFFVIIGFNGLMAIIDLPSLGFLTDLVLLLSVPPVFFLLFKYLVRNSPSWQGCLVGGIVSGLLFMFAKSLVSLYLVANPVLTIFGATGLTLVLLVWVYVLAAIIFYGAAVAVVYDRMNIIAVR